MEYQLIRSRRKTLEISIKPGGILVVRAPLRFPKKQIELSCCKNKVGSWKSKKLWRKNRPQRNILWKK